MLPEGEIDHQYYPSVNFLGIVTCSLTKHAH